MHAPLTQQECWRLLRTAEVGRVSYTESAMPIVRAVPYVVDGGGVVFAMRWSAIWPDLFDVPTVVAFEAGEWTRYPRAGWSVRFIGKAQAVPECEYADVEALGLTSWIDGEPARYVRIGAEIVDGTQVSPEGDLRP